MSDRPVEVERVGIEHVPDDLRHGSPRRTFTLWFAANLTIADYVIGVLATVYWGLTLEEAIPILVAGNLLGGVLLGLAAAMGPSVGFPQMVSSRATFSRFGNYLPGALNWVSSAGWFTVNTVLAVFALQVVLPGASFPLAAAAYVAIQATIAVYGHDFIHLFEKAMSVVLGLLFLLIFALTVPRLGDAFAYAPSSPGGGIPMGAISLLLVASFSYLMSWAPYASDYSRYLKASASKREVALLALAGGVASSFAVEVLGAVVGALTPSQTASLGFFGGLNYFAGGFGVLAMAALILGAFAADALNLYTNSLSALVLGVRAARWKTVVAGAAVSFVLAVAFGERFESFFENFLLLLAYWIMPWLALVLVDFYALGRTTAARVAEPGGWDVGALAAYGVAVAASVPFMVPSIQLGFPFGALAPLFGGADVSYFVSFGVALVLGFALRKRSGR
jgi:nucleobase:cation symporter-1, NCS1 family